MRLIDADALSELLVKTYEKAPTEKALLFVALLLKNNEQVPTVEAKTTEDCIIAYGDGYETARRLYERQQGEWVYNSYGNGCGNWHCSECGIIIVMCKNSHNNFCPNCGADMRGKPDQLRDCENCVHHSDNGCEVWECEFEKRSDV